MPGYRQERPVHLPELVSRDGQKEKQCVLHRFIQVTQVKEQGNEQHHDPDTTYRGQHPRHVKAEHVTAEILGDIAHALPLHHGRHNGVR